MDASEENPSEEEVKAVMAEAMAVTGTPPEFVYAFEKTGRMITDRHLSLLTTEEIAEWEAAVREYRATHSESLHP